jgi:hypothetical protein
VAGANFAARANLTVSRVIVDVPQIEHAFGARLHRCERWAANEAAWVALGEATVRSCAFALSFAEPIELQEV